MKKMFLIGSLCLLAGLGLGVVVTVLLEPGAPTSEPEASPPPGAQHHPPRERAVEFDSTYEEPPAPANEAREPAPPALTRQDRPQESWQDRGGPPRMDWMGTNQIPEEIRGNREAVMAWMADRQKERAAALRTNFIGKARLSQDETVRFDVLMAAMNMRLKEKTAVWKQALEDGSITRAEVRARAMNEISQAMVLTYDELDRSMPSGWRNVAGEDFDLRTFVDPETMHDLRPLMRGGFRSRGGPEGQQENPPQQR